MRMMSLIRTSWLIRPELPLEPSYMATSQVTEAGRGIAECLIVVTDSEIDLDTISGVSSESCAWRNVNITPFSLYSQ